MIKGLKVGQIMPADPRLADMVGLVFQYEPRYYAYNPCMSIYKIVSPGRAKRVDGIGEWDYPRQFASAGVDLAIRTLPPGYYSEITPKKIANVQKIIADWIAKE